MGELEVLEKIASYLEGIRVSLGSISFTLFLMLFFKNMGGK